MLEPEFKIQTLRSTTQWESGLLCKLHLTDVGISLFSSPAFDQFVAIPGSPEEVGGLAVDECGQLYWAGVDPDSQGQGPARAWSLYRLDLNTGVVVKLAELGECDPAMGIPSRIWLSRECLFVLDERRNRILAFSREHFQILLEIAIDGTLLDADFDGDRSFFALEGRGADIRICRYQLPDYAPGLVGGCLPSTCCESEDWKSPIGIAYSPMGYVYVLDRELPGFLRFDPADFEHCECYGLKGELVGNFNVGPSFPCGPAPDDLLPEDFEPAAIDIDRRGVIYVISKRALRLHHFDADGSYLGAIALPEGAQEIDAIAFGEDSSVYLATNAGVARFTLSITMVGEKGVYYTKTLDNGVEGGEWHRFELEGRLPPRTSVEVYYHASDQEALQEAIDNILSQPELSGQEKKQAIEDHLAPHWSEPEIFRGSVDAETAPEREAVEVAGNERHDMLPIHNHGRYLWLKLELSTFDEIAKPALQRLSVHYPRQSYLRYLPATYREDPVSAVFVERFLSLFETHLYGLDREIDVLHRYFDPDLAPAEFLPWLGCWINLALDEGLPEARKRALLSNAPRLYRLKGTPQGLAEFIGIYTGRRAFVIEPGQLSQPFLLGESIFLGLDSYLISSGVPGFRLGDTSALGCTALRTAERDPLDPFLATAGRFTVVVDMSAAEFSAVEATLRRIIDEQKPAHTAYILRSVSDADAVGTAMVGISATVNDFRPFQVGVTPLRLATAVATGMPGARLGRNARL